LKSGNPFDKDELMNSRKSNKEPFKDY
jgi:hypothetical protein